MRVPVAALWVVSLWPAGLALADCALPVGYRIVPDSQGNVQIYLENFAGRTCPDHGLLRRDLASGDVVMIAACAGDAFLDECVPAGSYQYGLAVPYSCAAASCDTQYYQTVQLAGPSDSCTRSGPAPAPVDPATVPWSDQQDVCSYHRLLGGCGVAPRGAVLGTNLVLGLAGLALWRRRPGRRPRGSRLALLG